jgi:hypothetical protein
VIEEARMSPKSRGAVTSLSFLLIPLALGACSKAGSNTEDDLFLPPVATFTVGGTLTGLAAGESIVVRLDHDFSELVFDDSDDIRPILRPTPRIEFLTLDETRNDEFWFFDVMLPAGAVYQVRIDELPQGQVCRISNREGVMPEDDLVDIDIVCDDAVIGQPALNDSGIDWCSDTRHPLRDATALEKRDGIVIELQPGVFEIIPGCADIASTHPGQDGLVGRDAVAREDAINATNVLAKDGDGEAGFDFTKISNSGNPLPPGAALGPAPGDWGCTRDNLTGLTWEVKVDDATHPRHRGWTYTWFNSTGVNDGGSAGSANGGLCIDDERCDTEKYAAEVNAAGLCGAADWRMPSREELRSIMHYGRPAPAVDPAYFPDSAMLDFFWTGSPYSGDPGAAGDVGIRDAAWTFAADGGSGIGYKAAPLRVRLVRRDP